MKKRMLLLLISIIGSLMLVQVVQAPSCIPLKFGDNIYIKSNAFGTYLKAMGTTDKTPIRAESTGNMFKLVDPFNPSSTSDIIIPTNVTFKSILYDRYVTAESVDFGRDLTTIFTWIGGWERFSVSIADTPGLSGNWCVAVGSYEPTMVNIKSHHEPYSGGKYVVAEPDGTVKNDRQIASTWEKFFATGI